MTVCNPSVSVIIPFYQCTAEPLIRAIRSILAQEGVDRPQVLIVDDGSPVPAQTILDENFPGHEDFVRIIVQHNAGAATARNTGLDNLSDSACCIAFLDSDDEWTPDHLANAVRMLEQGYDFYFADHQRSKWQDGKFTMTNLSLEQNTCLDAASGLYEYTGDILFPVMNDHLVQTSSVVCRQNSIKDIRFPVDLVLGEDEIFWVKAMRAARKIGFCKNIEVLMGKGVNISQEGDADGDWGHERAFQLLAQNIRYWQRVPALLPTEPGLEEIRRAKTRQLRQNLAASILHRLKRGRGLPMRPTLDFTLADPMWIFSLWTALSRHLTGKHHE